MKRHPEGCDPSSYHSYPPRRKPSTTRERARNRASWDPTLLTLPGMQTALRELERLGPSLYRGTIPRQNIDRLANDLTSILLTHVNQVRTKSKRPSPTTPNKEAVTHDARSSRIHDSSFAEHRNQAVDRYRPRRESFSHDPTGERDRSSLQRNSLRHEFFDHPQPRRRRRRICYDEDDESGADEEFRRPQRPRRSKEIRGNLNDELAYEYIAEAARQQEDRRKREVEEVEKAKLAAEDAEAAESSDDYEERDSYLKVVRPKPYVRQWALESDYATLTPLSTEPDDDTDTEIYRKWNARRVRKPFAAHEAQESSIRELSSVFPLGRKNRLMSDMLIDTNLMKRAAAHGQRATVNSSVLQRLPRIPNRSIVPGGWNVRDVELTHGFRSSPAMVKSVDGAPDRALVSPAPTQSYNASGEKVLNDNGHVQRQAGPLFSSKRNLDEVSLHALSSRRRPPMSSIVGARPGPRSGLLNAGTDIYTRADLMSTQAAANPGAFTTAHLRGSNHNAVPNRLPLAQPNRLRSMPGPVDGTGSLQLARSSLQAIGVNHTQFDRSNRHGMPQNPTGAVVQNRSAQLLPHGTVRGAHMNNSQLAGTPNANQIHRSSMHPYLPGAQQSRTQLDVATGQIARSGMLQSHPHLQRYAVGMQGSKFFKSGTQNSYQRQMNNLLPQEQHRLLEAYRQRALQPQWEQVHRTLQYGHDDRRLSGEQKQVQPMVLTPQLTEEGRRYQQILRQQQSQMHSPRSQLRQEQAIQAMKHQLQLQNLHQQPNLQFPVQFGQNRALSILNSHVQTPQLSLQISHGVVPPNRERFSLPSSSALVSNQTKYPVSDKKQNSTVTCIPQTRGVASTAREHCVSSRSLLETPLEMPELGTEMERAVLADAHVSSNGGSSTVYPLQNQAPEKTPPPPTKSTLVARGDAAYSRVTHSGLAVSRSIANPQEKHGLPSISAATLNNRLNSQHLPASSCSAGTKNGYSEIERCRAESQPTNSSIEHFRDQMQERERQYEEAYMNHYEIQLKKVKETMEEFFKQNSDDQETSK